MNDLTQDPLTQHQIARAEIDAWRGCCLDLYARTEQAVGKTLEQAISNGKELKLAHLAGQRFDTLQELAETEPATTKQREALVLAISSWRRVESERFLLAHGTVQELIDRRGDWHVRFDAQIYKTGKSTPTQWCLSKSEAMNLRDTLETRFKALSGQLGHFRKRLAS